MSNKITWHSLPELPINSIFRIPDHPYQVVHKIGEDSYRVTGLSETLTLEELILDVAPLDYHLQNDPERSLFSLPALTLTERGDG